ncbi:MAG: sulfatase-like hydrolase/transferase, partial [Planctomycetota bacterium]|nr:sulfatase-like hydrolase/transferase [Planctomycetota bacterium]
SVAPLTLPSHASMLTGLTPLRHGVRDNGLWALSGEAETLAERASGAGYQTGAFVSAAVLGGIYGLSQGFDVYDEPQGSAFGTGHGHLERDAKAVTRAAQRWIENRDTERPFFLWVHYFDPHAPYEPKPKYLAQAGGDAYLGEVAQMDAEIGHLVDTLAGEVGMENLVVALAADHGESLGRHDEPTHSIFCYDATLRVPLFVRLPGAERGGERSKAMASVTDVFPTMLAAMDLGSAGSVDGLNLLAGVPDDRGVYVESYCGYLNYGWSGITGWVDSQGKYLHSSEPEFYAFPADPGELTNLYEGKAPRWNPYISSLKRLAQLPRLGREDLASSQSTSETMRALGYAGAASSDATVPEPLFTDSRPAPATRTAQLEGYYDATILARNGDVPAAIRRLQPIAKANPDNVYANDVLGELLIRDRRFKEANTLLLALLGRGHDRYSVRMRLATSFEQLGQTAEAIEHYERALKQSPGDSGAEEALQRLR